MSQGQLHVYTGDGKGKTTAAVGLAVRAAGHGLKSYIGQFLKGRSTGEIDALRRIPEITIEQYGSARFVLEGEPRDAHLEEAKAGLRRARAILESGEYAIIILDEVNVALDLGLLTREEVEEALERVAPETEIVCTGRGAPGWLIERAGLVSEIRKVKHYAERGLQARDGIEQ
jgi:cob(I)alamin adenosyltransferase